MAHIVIIGNGIAGITCARHVRKQGNVQITVISGETEHFFSRTALMYIYMGHMKYEHTKPYEDWFWGKNKIDLVFDFVTGIEAKAKSIRLKSGKNINYDKLVLATGSQPNKFGWPGQDLPGVQGLYSYQDLEILESNSKNCKRAVIVGGGLIGIELAEMLASRKISVTFLVREKSFWDLVLPAEESAMINRHIVEHHIDLRLNTELREIKAGPDGKASAVVTSTGEEIPCQVVGLTAGVHANVGLAKSFGVETNRGILVDDLLQTNLPDVYAIGDCAELRNPLPHRKAIEQVWYTGRMMGETLALTLTGTPTRYVPGIWFNSAKFLDIEYQTYGSVPAIASEGVDSFWWEHPDGKKGIRINFDQAAGTVLGMNAMGIRQRHQVWDSWIRQKTKVDRVINELEKANFDPEFFDTCEQEIKAAFSTQFPYFEIEKKRKKKLFGIF
ncbi:FAD-dependent oxidoreductase [Imperialibacter roseus]|uniref:FAD-dependent oxidoreductase n=1 Tax=Imperialibacter roseus TaxID=1324217 RepID=A0ABZ0IR67_9BACT|nr:FAD-dependent oxidoreductase [Imperialibacter roseus]WOK06987.1 FAD-dependent oxidoreductase [Imperialibacter roseus]